MIEKKHIDKVSFVEFLGALIIFCLFTREEVVSFVFCMLDQDGDHIISKLDIFRFLLQFRNGYKVFLANYTRAIEITRTRRGDKINIMQFDEIIKYN